MAEEQIVEKSSDDEFDDAFGQAVAAAVAGVPLADTPAVDKDAKDTPEDEEEVTSDELKGEAGDKGSVGEPAVDNGANAEPATEGAEPKEEGDEISAKPAAEALNTPPVDVSGITRDDFARINEKLDKLQPKEAESNSSAQQQEEPETFSFSADEQKLLDEYEKEWEDHAKVAAIREKKLVYDIEQRVVSALDAVLQSINEGLAPVIQNHVLSAKEKHFSALSQAHSDWQLHREGVSKWIDAQPAYLREAMRKTYDEGDTEGSIDLLTRYKKEIGHAAAPTQNKGAPVKDVVSAEKVAATAPVQERRTVVQTQGVDMDDYEAAWKEAAG